MIRFEFSIRLRKPNSEDKATESDTNVAAAGPANALTASIANNQSVATRDSLRVRLPEDGQTPAVQEPTNQAPCTDTHQTPAVQNPTNQAPCSSTHQTLAVQDPTNQAPCTSTHQTPAVQDLTNQAPCTSTHQTPAVQDSTNQAPCTSTHQTPAVQDPTNLGRNTSRVQRGPGAPPVSRVQDSDFGFSLDNTMCW